MKKILTLVFAVVLTAAMLVPCFAVRDMVEPVGEVYAPRMKAPTLDGVLSEGEWNKKATFTINDWNMRSVDSFGYLELPEGWTADINVGWDDNYIYIASVTTDLTLAPRFDNEVDEAGNVTKAGTEGDYFIMYFVFDDPCVAATMQHNAAIAWCLNNTVKDGKRDSLALIYGNGENHQTKGGSIWLVLASEDYGATMDADNNTWTWEGRFPISELLASYNEPCGTNWQAITSGMTVSSLIDYNDFHIGADGRPDPTRDNWFGTQSTGYEEPANFFEDHYGISILFCEDNEVKERPETTEPQKDTEPEDTTAKADDTTANAGDTSAKADDTTAGADVTTGASDVTTGETDNKGGANVGLIIGIAAAVVVVAGVVIGVVASKKKK